MKSVARRTGTAMASQDAASGARLLFAAFLFAFLAGAISVAANKDVTRGFDELAHASYVAEIQRTGDPWPRLEQMRMLDPVDFRFVGDGNYLNHPSLFYLPFAALGPRLENQPGAIYWHRMGNVAIGLAAVAVVLALGLIAGLSKLEFVALGVPIVSIPALTPLAGSINNDNLAFLGGAVAVTAAYGLLSDGRFRWLAAMLGGLILASAAKLTGLLLAGGFVVAVLAYLVWKRQLPKSWLPVVGIAAILAVLPYLAFAYQYGSLAPNTPAQLEMLRAGAQAMGWADAPRMNFAAYSLWFSGSFIAGWMPSLAPREPIHYAMLVLPLAAVLCAVAGFWIAAQRSLRHRQGSLDVIVLAGFAALASTFVIHVWFSHGRHLETGWLMDAFPRYYFPLAAILPLAGILVLREVGQPRLRLGILAILIVGPLLFRVFGAPIAS